MVNVRVQKTPMNGGMEAILTRLSPKGQKRMSIQIVYAAPYAVYVHEDLTCNHPNGGKAKYLEDPIRSTAKQVNMTVTAELRAKRSLEEALIRGINIPLAASLLEVPVDTGFLRDSAHLVITTGDV